MQAFVPIFTTSTRMLVASTADQSVQTITPAVDTVACDGQRIIGIDRLRRAVIVQDVATGEVRRFLDGTIGADIYPESARNGFVVLRRDAISGELNNTSVTILDTRTGEQFAVDLGLQAITTNLSGDYLLAGGLALPGTSTLSNPSPFAPFEELQSISLNWRTGERRLIATDDIVDAARVARTDIFWTAGDGGAITVRATSVVDGMTREVMQYAPIGISNAHVAALGDNGVAIHTTTLPNGYLEDPASPRPGSYLVISSLVYQPFTGDAVTLWETMDHVGPTLRSKSPKAGLTSRIYQLGRFSAILDDQVVFLDANTADLVIFDPANGELSTIELPVS